MWRPSEGRFALGGLFLLAMWLWVVLPLLYRPTSDAWQRPVGGATHAKNAPPSSNEALAGEDGTEYLPPLFGFKLKITDTLLVTFTLGLTVFTGLLWKSTQGLYFVTRIVADADRPHMVPSELQLSGIEGPNEDGFIRTRLTYRFTNYGRSPAFMKRFALMFRVLGDVPLEPTPAYGEATDTDFIIVVNGWWGSTETHPVTILIATQDVEDAISGKAKLAVIGLIEYDDVAQQKHRMRFAYELVLQEGKNASVQFRPIGPPSYREYS